MFSAINPITKEKFDEFMKTAPHVTVIDMYCISKYHEKFRLTGWCMKELERRGFTKEAMAHFEVSFIDFYHQMLKQEDL
jgi:hypothetical protein